MLCEKCGKNEATFYYHENVNGEEKTYKLCADCKKELEKSGKLSVDGIGSLADKIGLFGGEFFSDHFNQMNAFLSEILGDGTSKYLGSSEKIKKCPACGTTLNEIAHNGMAGCPKCYETFEEELERTISKIHGHTAHTGRTPVKFRAKNELQKKIELLEAEQKNAVRNEDYERAAEIRDELKKLREEF